MEEEKKAYLYEMENEDILLTEDEEKIMRAMRRLNNLWKKYKAKPSGNNLILFCGMSCDMRYGRPSADKRIESYPHITCDGGDGGDIF